LTPAFTAPHHCAVTPLSNSPNSFEAPTNNQFTALTLPRISGGVANCSRLERTTTLIMSLAPTTTSATALNQILFDTPNTTVAAPKMPTQISIVAPAFRLIGFTTIVSDTASAPTEGIARSSPSPRGPARRMSVAKIGNSAVAPPSSTANRSSEIDPSGSFDRHTYSRPASMVFTLNAVLS